MTPLSVDLPLLAVDPGKHVGWALALGGRLSSFGTVKDVDWNNPRAVDYVLDSIIKPDWPRPGAIVLVIEMPRVYPAVSKWKGDPQHIVRLAFLAGRIAERFSVWKVVEPRTWQGGSPPERVLRNRTRARLTASERVYVDDAKLGPHAWDAIGILVYSLNRALQTD